MKYTFKNWLLYLTVFSIILLSSCRPNFDEASWAVDATAPIATSSMSLGDLLSDSIIQTNPDSSLTMVFSNNIYTFNVDSLVSFRDTVLPYVASIENLELGDQTISYPITLGEIASSPDAGLAGTLIIANNGGTMPIPAIGDPDPIASDDIDIDANQYFESITVDSGYMDVKLVNGLPIDVTDLIFLLKNQSNQEILVQDTFPIIPSNDSVMQTYDLEGKTIYGDLQAKIIEMSSPGSGGTPVEIDTSDALIANLTIRDIKPYAATAIFPAQNIIEKIDKMPMSGLGIIQLSGMRLKHALLRMEAVSTIQDSVFFDFAIPSATLDGVPFQDSHVVPPAPIGDTSRYTYDFPFDDYWLDLRGIGPFEQAANADLDGNGIIDPDTVNTFIQTITGAIDSTSEIVSLSLNDSLYINIQVIDMVSDYAIGFLGKDTIEFGPSTTNFDMFNSITDGTIDFSDVNVTFEVSNGIGADAKIQFSEMNSINTRTGTTISLQNNEFTNNIAIPSATDMNGSDPEFIANDYTLELNSDNSNIEEFIENLPDQLSYSLSLERNANIDPPPTLDEVINNPPNFIYYDGGLEARMNMEIPMTFASNQLTLVDTTELNLSAYSNQTAINSGVFNLIVDNGFPFDAEISLELLDAAGNVLNSLVSSQTAESGILGSNGKISESTESRIVFNIANEDLADVFSAENVSIRVAFTTTDSPNHIKIYSYYNIDMTLTADFNYNVNNQ